MDSDGFNPVDLTNTAGASETAPEFSSDGTKIVYISGGGNDDIWVMNANGTGQTPLTETSAPVQNVAPGWSPDGSKIAYSVLEGPVGERGLHVMNANGTSQTQLLDESAPIPSDVLSWSPDGTQIAYKSAGIGGELRLVGASGGPTGLLVENSGADYPAWAAIPAESGGPSPTSNPPPASTPPASSTVPSPVSSPAPKVAPSNHFVLGRLKPNKKKGTAVLTVSVAGAGTVVLTGKGVKKASAVAKTAGKLSLMIKATGEAKQKLAESGEVKLKLKITFAPAGGARAAQLKKVTLKLAGG
jgi:dipeptidyl aminopeptidase/acylaminoacyl peptidase